MSASLLLNGIPQPPVSVDLTTTNQTEVLDNDTTFLFMVTGLVVSNDSGSAATLRLDIDGDHVWFKSVPANDSVEVPTPIFLFPGVTLQATAGTGNAILLHVNYLMGRESIGS